LVAFLFFVQKVRLIKADILGMSLAGVSDFFCFEISKPNGILGFWNDEQLLPWTMSSSR